MSRKRTPTHQRLDIAVERRDGVAVVCPRGELDMFSAPELRDVLGDLRERKESVLLQLHELTFMDSSGLRLIWDSDVAAREDGIEMTLTAGRPEVMRVFEVTGLIKRLPFVGLD
jgi:anti-anti-sigma factor